MNKISIRLLFFVVALVVVATAEAQQPGIKYTVKKISIGDDNDLNPNNFNPNAPAPKKIIRGIELIADEGHSDTVWLSYSRIANIGNWFVNEPRPIFFILSERLALLPEMRGNNLILVLADDKKLLVQMELGDKTYRISIGVGSKLVVRKYEDGKYDLLVDETVALLPPSDGR